ncbi:DNA ligase [Streptomyces albidoflavus]|nr:DNA ligase [Streptomyces albidoflavus]RZE05049.1 DNA ligase [Streptomyces albidoflavus]
MRFPVPVAVAQAVPGLPAGEGWYFEPKYDGDRQVLWKTPEGVRLQSRSGRDVTAWWPDLVAAAAYLPNGVVLDGETVVWRAGGLDFGAVRSRASSSPARAAALARSLPASYAAWDCLAHPAHGDIRGWAYTRRRALLLEVLGPRGRPPIQPVPATDDRAVAAAWLEQLTSLGVEGVVCMRSIIGPTLNRRHVPLPATRPRAVSYDPLVDLPESLIELKRAAEADRVALAAASDEDRDALRAAALETAAAVNAAVTEHAKQKNENRAKVVNALNRAVLHSE